MELSQAREDCQKELQLTRFMSGCCGLLMWEEMEEREFGMRDRHGGQGDQFENYIEMRRQREREREIISIWGEETQREREM